MSETTNRALPPRLAQHAADYFGHIRTEIAPLLPEASRRVLELGCGGGGTMQWLRAARPVERAVGLELDPSAAARARQVFDAVREVDLNQQRPDLGDERFDLVLALDVLEHLVDPWSTLRWVRETLVPGGTLIVSLPNVAHYSVVLPLALKGAWDYADEGLLDRTHLRFFNRATARALVEQAGFVVTRTGTTSIIPDPIARLGLEGARWRWYNKRLMETLLPERWITLQYLIAATRSAG